MTESKHITSLVGWYLILPSAGPLEITYYVTKETPKVLLITRGTAFHQSLKDEPTDRQQLLEEVYNEGTVAKGSGHAYYFITPSAGGWDLDPVYKD